MKEKKIRNAVTRTCLQRWLMSVRGILGIGGRWWRSRM